MEFLTKNFANWTSGNEKIDNLIQEMQLEINDYKDIIFEWIPYNQFNVITKEDCYTMVHLAEWKDGPLYWEYVYEKKYIRNSNNTVALKCLDNSQNIIDVFLNKV